MDPQAAKLCLKAQVFGACYYFCEGYCIRARNTWCIAEDLPRIPAGLWF